MTSTQGQDIVLCQLCPNAVEYHCNFCHVNLCLNCVPKHLVDKTKRHEIADFIYRRERSARPECKSHKKTQCEMFCNDCHEPTCALCVKTTHKDHDITDIENVLQKMKLCITADADEIENKIIPKFRDVSTAETSKEFKKVINAIQNQEDNICKGVRDISSQLQAEVMKHQTKLIQKNKEIKSDAAKTEKELWGMIQNNKIILETNNVDKILSYRSRNASYNHEPKQIEHLKVMFVSGAVRQNLLQEMFGLLETRGQSADYKLRLMANPVILSTIDSRFDDKGTEYLCMLLCVGKKQIWTCGDEDSIYMIDSEGSTLEKVDTSESVLTLALNANQDLSFSLMWPNTNVCKYNGHKMTTMFKFSQWCPRGLCYTKNNDLLISMRSLNETESKIVRYSGAKEIMVIQNDAQGKPLFSVDNEMMLMLTENGNRDICVADRGGGAVVVVNELGKFQFRYHGNISQQSMYKSFEPLHIARDVNNQIIIGDYENDIVHIIDSKGSFLCYIENNCKGGLSIDTDHNLAVGDEDTGRIQIIKYLQ